MNKNNNILRLALFFTVCTLSMFACTLSTFIMQAVSYYHVSATSAGTLESYQNLALLVFLFASFPFILRIGYRYSLILVMGTMVIISLFMPLLNSYWMIKLYLIGLGLVFVSMKVIVYSSVPSVLTNESNQAMFLSFLEFSWAMATLLGQWLIAYFLKNYPLHWLYFSWIFASIGILCIIFLCFVRFNEVPLDQKKPVAIRQQLLGILQMCRNRYILAVIVVLFLANLIEMGFGAWLPGFYQQAFAIAGFLSVKIASFAMLFVMAGRVAVIFSLKFLSYGKTLFLFYFCGLILLIYVLFNIHPSTLPIASLGNTPVIALLLVAFAFFLAPSAPILNSSVLSKTAPERHVLLMSLLTIVFAVASSFGARLIGQLIDHYGVVTGFKAAMIIPLVLLILVILPYEKFIAKARL